MASKGCAVAWRSEDAKDSSFALFLFLGCLVAPVGVIAHCYGHILYSVHRVSRKTTNAPPPDYFQGRKFCITKQSNFLPTWSVAVHSWSSSRLPLWQDFVLLVTLWKDEKGITFILSAPPFSKPGGGRKGVLERRNQQCPKNQKPKNNSHPPAFLEFLRI